MSGSVLFQGDARQAVWPERAHLAVLDPPYLLTSGGKRGEFGGALSSDRYDNSGKIVACDIDWGEIMRLVSGVLVDDADAYVFANDKNVRDALNAADAAGLRFHNLLVWDKISAVANRWYMKNCEFVLYLFKGKAKMIRDPSSKQLIRAPQIDETDHPTEKPVSLLEHYIRNSSDPGQIVIDPFMGSGSTGVAALKAGRRFFGAEIDPHFFGVARDRIEASLSFGQTAFAL